MPALAIGDRVRDLTDAHEGLIVDIDGGTAYVQQPNGVEIAFPLVRLKAWAPLAARVERTLAGPLRDTLLDPEAKRLLASVPREVLEAVARSWNRHEAGEQKRPEFAALPDSKRLEAIRIHLPSLPEAILRRHMNLVVAMRDRRRG